MLRPKHRFTEFLALALLVLAAFVVYSNTFEAPFVFDDRSNILENQFIRVQSLSPQELIRAAFASPIPTRPLPNASFALNHYFHGYRVAGYHLVNILIHISTGLILYFLVKATIYLTNHRTENESDKWIAFFTALLWLVHPLHTQSVTYIVQRMNSLAAMFYILSLLLYAKGRSAENKKTGYALFVGCFLSGLLALCSKENAASLFIFLFLYEWYFFQNAGRFWLRGKLKDHPDQGRKHLVIILVCTTIAAITSLIIHPIGGILSAFQYRPFTLYERLITESRVVVYYLSQLFFPHPSRLNLVHDFSLSTSILDPPTTLLSLFFLSGLATAAILYSKKQRLISFCILWFLGNLVIESSVIGLEIIFEHRTYLPSMMIIFMIVFLVYQLPCKKIGVSLLICSALALSFWTYERNIVWKSAVTLWGDCVNKSPALIRPHNNLGLTLAREGRYAEAADHFSEALRIKPGYIDARVSLGVSLKRQGKIREAEKQFDLILKNDPEHPKAHNNLGIIMKMKGRLPDAINHYRKALRADPGYAKAHTNLANALTLQGNVKEAIIHYNEAALINSTFNGTHKN